MAAGYIVVEMKISDPEQYKQYMAAAPATIAAAGGEYLVFEYSGFVGMNSVSTPARPVFICAICNS